MEAEIVIFGFTLVLCFIAATVLCKAAFCSELFLIVDALTDLFIVPMGPCTRAFAKRRFLAIWFCDAAHRRGHDPAPPPLSAVLVDRGLEVVPFQQPLKTA
jgi:hypothetical protein